MFFVCAMENNTVPKYSLKGLNGFHIAVFMGVAPGGTEQHRCSPWNRGSLGKRGDGRLCVFTAFVAAALTGVPSVLPPFGGLATLGHKRVRCPTEAP